LESDTAQAAEPHVYDDSKDCEQQR
jgi:hypothetical protein